MNVLAGFVLIFPRNAMSIVGIDAVIVNF